MTANIDNLYDLCNVINAVANRALDHVANNSTSGQMYLSYDKFSDLISEADFHKYGQFIADELSTRAEVLEPVSFEDGELDINMGLAYCKAYQWCDGDEEIFGCSFEDWLVTEPKPVYHPMSLTRLGEIGEKAVESVTHSNGHQLSSRDLGLTSDELVEFGNKSPLVSPSVDYIPGEDLFVGKWRVHVADTGEKYGTFNHLVNYGKPLIQFFDMSNVNPDFSPNGQFTGGEYYVETILGLDGWTSKEYPYGLSLAGDVPQWTVSSQEMALVVSYLESFESQRGKKHSLNQMIGSAQQKKESARGADPGTRSHDSGKSGRDI